MKLYSYYIFICLSLLEKSAIWRLAAFNFVPDSFWYLISVWWCESLVPCTISREKIKLVSSSFVVSATSRSSSYRVTLTYLQGHLGRAVSKGGRGGHGPRPPTKGGPPPLQYRSLCFCIGQNVYHFEIKNIAKYIGLYTYQIFTASLRSVCINN
jgi:hypothetical protein